MTVDVPNLIVDGYNVLRAAKEYASLADRDLEAARERLVRDAAAYAAGRYRCTVVFDGGGNPLSDGTPHRAGSVTVVFSPHGTSADAVVERLASRARARRRAALVVSSDTVLRSVTAGGGIDLMRAELFAAEVRAARSERRGGASSGPRRGAVETLIDAGIRERLRRWASGGSPR